MLPFTDLNAAIVHADRAHEHLVHALAHLDLAHRHLDGVSHPQVAGMRRHVEQQLQAIAWTATADPGGGVC